MPEAATCAKPPRTLRRIPTVTGVSTSTDQPEWTPEFLRTARGAAARAAADRSTSDADRLTLAVRELAAEVRALHHQLTGIGAEPRSTGALGEIDEAISVISRRV